MDKTSTTLQSLTKQWRLISTLDHLWIKIAVGMTSLTVPSIPSLQTAGKQDKALSMLRRRITSISLLHWNKRNSTLKFSQDESWRRSERHQQRVQIFTKHLHLVSRTKFLMGQSSRLLYPTWLLVHQLGVKRTALALISATSHQIRRILRWVHYPWKWTRVLLSLGTPVL